MSSAFKTLFTDLINHNGDSSKLNKDLSKQMLKVFVKETSPYFLISDSFFYVPAYFTQAALDEFQKKFPTTSFSDLNQKVILISNWSLELKKVDSNSVFTSYGGIEVRLIVNSFKPQLGDSVHPVRTTNDKEIVLGLCAGRNLCIRAHVEDAKITKRLGADFFPGFDHAGMKSVEFPAQFFRP